MLISSDHQSIEAILGCLDVVSKVLRDLRQKPPGFGFHFGEESLVVLHSLVDFTPNVLLASTCRPSSFTSLLTRAATSRRASCVSRADLAVEPSSAEITPTSLATGARSSYDARISVESVVEAPKSCLQGASKAFDRVELTVVFFKKFAQLLSALR